MTRLIQKIQDEIQHLEMEVEYTQSLIDSLTNEEAIKLQTIKIHLYKAEIKGLVKSLNFIRQENEIAFNQLKKELSINIMKAPIKL